MEQYGTVFDINYNTTKEPVYKAFIQYFDNPIFTKIKNMENETMYMAKIRCLLMNINRYLVVMCVLDKHPLGHHVKLSYLPWISFQTRSLESKYDILTTNYKSKLLLNDPIILQKRHNTHTDYICEKYKIKISLIHTIKNMYEYPEGGTLKKALETYQTIICFS